MDFCRLDRAVFVDSEFGRLYNPAGKKPAPDCLWAVKDEDAATSSTKKKQACEVKGESGESSIAAEHVEPDYFQLSDLVMDQSDDGSQSNQDDEVSSEQSTLGVVGKKGEKKKVKNCGFSEAPVA